MADLHEDGSRTRQDPDDQDQEQQQQKRKVSQRPSFADFWKRSKERGAGHGISFVSGHPSVPGASSSVGEDGNGKDKAQARRAQVRRAQIQHRQRKANYTKQLEMDVSRLRDMIDQTMADIRALENENESMRRQLQVDPNLLLGVSFGATPSQTPTGGNGLDDTAMHSWSSVDSSPQYTISLDFNDFMGTPTYRVSRSPSASSGSRSTDLMSNTTTLGPAAATTTTTTIEAMTDSVPGADFDIKGLSQDETDMAINFILSLEHTCWAHFGHSHFHPNEHDPSANETGHTLMASAIALQNAPSDVFGRMEGLQKELRADPESRPWTGDISWQTTGLSLESLRRLAATLNPPDKELTPVQAWFEIAKKCGLRAALDGGLIDRLAREFRGVVKCLFFGAAIERDAFDSIVERVVRDHGGFRVSHQDGGGGVS